MGISDYWGMSVFIGPRQCNLNRAVTKPVARRHHKPGLNAQNSGNQLSAATTDWAFSAGAFSMLAPAGNWP
jgi:hypothetical protein